MKKAITVILTVMLVMSLNLITPARVSAKNSTTKHYGYYPQKNSTTKKSTYKSNTKKGNSYSNKSKSSTKKTSSSYKNSSHKKSSKKYCTEWPDCDDYWDEDEFLDDWDGNIPDGSDAEDYWDNW